MVLVVGVGVGVGNGGGRARRLVGSLVAMDQCAVDDWTYSGVCEVCVFQCADTFSSAISMQYQKWVCAPGLQLYMLIQL